MTRFKIINCGKASCSSGSCLNVLWGRHLNDQKKKLSCRLKEESKNCLSLSVKDYNYVKHEFQKVKFSVLLLRETGRFVS